MRILSEVYGRRFSYCVSPSPVLKICIGTIEGKNNLTIDDNHSVIDADEDSLWRIVVKKKEG